MSEQTRLRPPVIELAVTRAKEFVRESEALFWVFGFPLILALALGFAFREKPPDRVPVAVVAGPNAAQRLAALQKSPVLLPSVMSEPEARDALRRGKVSLLIEGADTVVFRFDATRPDAQSARREADDALQIAAGRRDVVATREERVHEQGARYIDFLIPGLLGMNLMGTGMWSMGFTIANARMKKLLKRLVATPMRKTDFLLAQFLSRLIWLLIEVTVLVVFAWIVFGVRVNGSILFLAFSSSFGGFSFSGIGLLTASRARTIEAVSGLMNVIMMPMWLCAGVFFSQERFPDSLNTIIGLLPLTLQNDAIWAVINDAAGLTQIASKLALLAVWGFVTFMIGLKVFRWQ